MRSIEVRCCCDATMVLGWLVTDRKLNLGDKINFEMPDGDIGQLEVMNCLKEVESYKYEVALRSNDYTPEQLAVMPGFVPNPINKDRITALVDLDLVPANTHPQGTPTGRLDLNEIIRRTFNEVNVFTKENPTKNGPSFQQKDQSLKYRK